MHADPILAGLCEHLVGHLGSRTAILYGSRARGDAGADSDYDVAAFAPVATLLRDTRIVEGRYVDAFIYPETTLARPEPELLKLRGGVILFESVDSGTRLLLELDRMFAAGPVPLAADELRARRVWAWKMLDRIARGDAEGDYRRAWLLTALLEDYFTLRGLWFLGPKDALRWLDKRDAPCAALFRAALRTGADLADIRFLVGEVVGDRPDA